MTQSVLSALRDLVPIRPLTRHEAMRIAELQATRFRKAIDAAADLLPETAITELPRLQVERVRPLPVSGATQWSHGRWLVLLNAGDSAGRQRFSLAHEFKHILDHRFIDVLYERIPEPDRESFIEQVCDYFAGCLLVPRPALKRAWCNGVQQPRGLATRFGVSQAAIAVRLNQVGLTDRSQRCSRQANDWLTEWQHPAPRYRRLAPIPIP